MLFTTKNHKHDLLSNNYRSISCIKQEAKGDFLKFAGAFQTMEEKIYRTQFLFNNFITIKSEITNSEIKWKGMFFFY